MKKPEIKTPPEAPALTTEQLGRFMVLNRQTLPPTSNDADVQRRIAALLGEPRNVSRYLFELVASKAHAQALYELRNEADAAAQAEMAKSRAAGKARAKREFAALDLSTLENVIDYFLYDAQAILAVLTADEKDRVLMHGTLSKESLLRTLAQVSGGKIALHLETSRLCAFVVSPDGVEGFTKFRSRFRLPVTLSWTLGDGDAVHLYTGTVEDGRNEHLCRAVLDGVQLTSTGTLVIPPQAGVTWATLPRDVEQGNGSGLPTLPGELVDILRGLRNADPALWGRYFAAMLSNAAPA